MRKPKKKIHAPKKKQIGRKPSKIQEIDRAPKVRRVLLDEDEEQILENVMDQDPERA